MINKEVTKQINDLKAELEYWKDITESNIRTSNYWYDKYQDLLQDNDYLERTNNDLNAERVYWEETAINWRDKYEEAELELQDQKESAKYWQDQYEEVDTELDYWQSYIKQNT